MTEEINYTLKTADISLIEGDRIQIIFTSEEDHTLFCLRADPVFATEFATMLLDHVEILKKPKEETNA